MRTACRTIADIRALVHEQACEAAMADVLDAKLDDGRLTVALNELRARPSRLSGPILQLAPTTRAGPPLASSKSGLRMEKCDALHRCCNRPLLRLVHHAVPFAVCDAENTANAIDFMAKARKARPFRSDLARSCRSNPPVSSSGEPKNGVNQKCFEGFRARVASALRAGTGPERHEMNGSYPIE